MFSHFFIDRPVLATVLSLVIVIVGGVALFALPIAQYPEIAPPTVSVTANFPGASARVVAETVATPIEQEVNGVENLLYMTSRSTNDGSMSIDVVFKLGTDLDMAQVLVQNRVNIALPRVPEEVRRIGVITKKRSPNVLLAVNIVSPDDSFDQLFLNNYAALQIKDNLARINGVGDIVSLGSREYSMRVWVDPEKLAARDMTVGDVVRAVREQNVQVAAGRVGQPPSDGAPDFQFVVNTLGRLASEQQFADLIVKDGNDGELVRLSDIAKVELGARNYDVGSTLDGKPSALLAVFPNPGANAVATAQLIKAEMEQIKQRFPKGLDYRIVYDTTVFVEESIYDVIKTLIEAFVLVFIVVLVFLQSWRATLLPMIEVPVSLIGTFAVMSLLGFSLNNLSLFGLVLAIGIVVDDAIVVIENVERWMAQGLSPRDATRKAMEEVTGPVIAVALVLSAVFIPTAFITGISGQFYRQFALTIAASTIISAFNALTMTPARCVLLLKPHDSKHGTAHEVLPWWGLGSMVGAIAGLFVSARMNDGHHAHGLAALYEGDWTWWLVGFSGGFVLGGVLIHPVNTVLSWLLGKFNQMFDWITEVYGRMVGMAIRGAGVMLVAYAGLMGLTWLGFNTVPAGFIPNQDQGYLVLNCQLPEGANLQRTEAVMQRINEIALKVPGIVHTVGIPGYSILTSANLPNVGGMFVTLDSFENRRTPDLQAQAIIGRLFAEFASIEDALVLVFNAPPVQGIGNAGGFKLQIQDRNASEPYVVQAAAESVMAAAAVQPGIAATFSSFGANQPQIFLAVDRTKAKTMGVDLTEVFDALQGYLGATYANDITRFGRNWQVNVQADAQFRRTPEDIGELKVRNRDGDMLPLQTMAQVESMTGPSIVFHHNLLPTADVNGILLPSLSSGQAVSLMERLARQELPAGFDFAWTELTLQQILAGNTAIFVFVLGTVFVFLVLAAQYESWTLPLSVVLIVPMCLAAAIGGVWYMGMDNNLFTQIGLVVLIGLASKNAILIVEFAKQIQDIDGKDRVTAAVEASTLRLRPILMTSLAFILGVVPLVRAVGAGAEMRRALGVAVFSGMLGVTLFGIFFTPVFYCVVRWWTDSPANKTPLETADAAAIAKTVIRPMFRSSTSIKAIE